MHVQMPLVEAEQGSCVRIGYTVVVHLSLVSQMGILLRHMLITSRTEIDLLAGPTSTVKTGQKKVPTEPTPVLVQLVNCQVVVLFYSFPVYSDNVVGRISH